MNVYLQTDRHAKAKEGHLALSKKLGAINFDSFFIFPFLSSFCQLLPSFLIRSSHFFFFNLLLSFFQPLTL